MPKMNLDMGEVDIYSDYYSKFYFLLMMILFVRVVFNAKLLIRFFLKQLVLLPVSPEASFC